MRLIDADALNVDDIPTYYGSSVYIEDVKAWLDEQATVELKQNTPELVIRKPPMRNGGAYRSFCPKCGKQQKMSKYGLWYCERCGQALKKVTVLTDALD